MIYAAILMQVAVLAYWEALWRESMQDWAYGARNHPTRNGFR